MGVFYTLNTIGQQVILSDAANVKLPQRAEKLNKQQALSYVGKKFNNDKMALYTIKNANTNQLYKVDNVLISFFTANRSVEDDHLNKLKKGLDETSKNDKTYTSSIRTVNENQILITHYSRSDIEYYDFFCFSGNKSNLTNAVSGGLQFAKADHDNGTVILTDILNSLKFVK